MNRAFKIAAGVVAALGLGLAVVTAVGQPFGMSHADMHGMGQGMGPGVGAGPHGPMGGPTAMLTRQDEGSGADMEVVFKLLFSNTKIQRSVTKLPDGIRTTTASDDPAVAKAIQTHVASMSQRLQDGREFNIFSATLPILFANHDKIASSVEMTPKGAMVTRTSTDPKVVTALQSHSGEVTELVEGGMMAMRRGMMTVMGMGTRMHAHGMGPGMLHGVGPTRGAPLGQGETAPTAPAPKQ